MKKLVYQLAYNLLIVCVICSTSLLAQNKPITYYLPDISYDPSITTPEEFLGFQIGDWHVSHDKMYYYMLHLAEQSDRISLVEIGRTHEDRPLINMIITTPENQSRLEELKQNHFNLTDGSLVRDINDVPIVVYQGYSIHGNEASGGNAALLNAYYLAAGQSDHVLELLNESIIIIDPCFNPDGFHRFSTWVNSHKSKNISADPQHREYTEPWPRGRTNHYWFDLNRDWLLLTHPESRARIKVFHEWKPDILTDHHEMGTNSTFFFQPGIPSRTNPNTPTKNQDLTFEIAKFHAVELDKIGSLYYTKESFDDFYYGKGSTYPDINGSIGILFEQASSRGHAQESNYGTLTFPFTVRNQVATSISTQNAALALKDEILKYKNQFFNNSVKFASSSKNKGYSFSGDGDTYKLNRFLELLNAHKIDVYQQDANGNKSSNQQFYIPIDQKQSRLIKAIFEKVTDFKDSLFYDVSAWTLPLAFDIEYGSTTKVPALGKKVEKLNKPTYFSSDSAPYAYIINWSDYMAPSLLDKLLAKNITVSSSNKAFSYNIDGRSIPFAKGSLIVPGQQTSIKDKSEFRNWMKKLSNELMVEIVEVGTGLGFDGFSLGSPMMNPLKKAEIAILVGRGVNGYDAGEIWHHFDQILNIRITLLDINRMGQYDLSRYNTIIMPDGSYNTIQGQVEVLKEWVKKGNTLIGFKRALNWLTQQKIIELKNVTDKKEVEKTKNPVQQIPYERRRADSGSKFTGGTIVNMKIDLTHPLFYGYKDAHLPMFKRGNQNYIPSNDPYSTPGVYTQNPVLSGYMHRDNLKFMKGAAGVMTFSVGRGKVVAIVDNPLFRGYWWGGSKLFANAVLIYNK